MSDGPFQAANGENGTVPSHGGHARRGPARGFFFGCNVPELDDALACSNGDDVGLVGPATFDDPQVTLAVLQPAQLSDILRSGQVLVMNPIPSAEE